MKKIEKKGGSENNFNKERKSKDEFMNHLISLLKKVNEFC